MRKLSLHFILYFFLLHCPVDAQVSYHLELDLVKSSRIGAENFAAIQRALYAVEGQYLKTRWTDEQTGSQKALGITYRLGKTILLDNIVDHFLVLTQHEVFGHGARYREFGYSSNSYHMNLFLPYGKGNGFASPGQQTFQRRGTFHESLVTASGGSEANTILSKTIRSKWLQRGRIHHRETLFYFFAAHDLGWYILRTKWCAQPDPRNDILVYLRTLNRLEGYPDEANYRLTIDDLARQTAINAFNPFLYLSLYAYVVSYLWNGEEDAPLPMFRVRDIGYLPSLRLGLTPFGSEVYFENFIVGVQRVANLYFRRGISTFHTFEGFGLHIDNLLPRRTVSFDTGLDIWRQPSLSLGGTTTRESRSGIGGAAFGRLAYTLKSLPPIVRIAVRAGYKTDGFLEGESLGRGFAGSIGLSFVE